MSQFGGFKPFGSFGGSDSQGASNGGVLGFLPKAGTPGSIKRVPYNPGPFYQKSVNSSGRLEQSTWVPGTPGATKQDQYHAAVDKTLQETKDYNDELARLYDVPLGQFADLVEQGTPQLMGDVEDSLGRLLDMDEMLGEAAGNVDKRFDPFLSKLEGQPRDIDRHVREAKQNARRMYKEATSKMDAAAARYRDETIGATNGFMSSFTRGVSQRSLTAKKAIDSGVDPASGRLLTPEEQNAMKVNLEAQTLSEIAPVFMTAWQQANTGILQAEQASAVMRQAFGDAEIKLGELGLQGEALKQQSAVTAAQLLQTSEGFKQAYLGMRANLRQSIAGWLEGSRASALQYALSGRERLASFLLNRPNSLINYAAALKDMMLVDALPGVAKGPGF